MGRVIGGHWLRRRRILSFCLGRIRAMAGPARLAAVAGEVAWLATVEAIHLPPRTSLAVGVGISRAALSARSSVAISGANVSARISIVRRSTSQLPELSVELAFELSLPSALLFLLDGQEPVQLR